MCPMGMKPSRVLAGADPALGLGHQGKFTRSLFTKVYAACGEPKGDGGVGEGMPREPTGESALGKDTPCRKGAPGK